MKIPEETERLRFRAMSETDDEFILDLLNSSGWQEFIGDKNVHNVEQARSYIRNSIESSYKNNEFGIWVVCLRDSGAVVGTCGLVNRDTLPDIDIGYAFLPQFYGQGFATEASLAVLSFAKNSLNLKRVLAIVSHGNHASVKVLEKLSFESRGDYSLGPLEDGGEDKVMLFSREF